MATLTTDPSPRLTEPVAPRRLLLVAALGTVYVAWGSTYLAVRVMVDEMPALMGSAPAPSPPVRSWLSVLRCGVVWSSCA